VLIERRGRDNGEIIEKSISDMSWQKMTSISLTFTEEVKRDIRNDLRKV